MHPALGNISRQYLRGGRRDLCIGQPVQVSIVLKLAKGVTYAGHRKYRQGGTHNAVSGRVAA